MMHSLRTAIVETIRVLPLALSIPIFRAYNKSLKLIGSEFCAKTYFNARLICDPRDLVQKMILHFGVWEPDVSRAIERNLAPGDVFVDIGANIGYDTLLASRSVGVNGKVVAIEASPKTYLKLKRNLELNHATNVRAVNVAVSDRPGKLNLYEQNEHNIGAMTTLEGRGGRLTDSIDALPLEDILTPDELSRVRLIKMDIEGAEPMVLRHLLDKLSLFSPNMDIIVEACPDDDFDAWKEVFERLIAADFRAYEIANSYRLEWYMRWRKPTELRARDVPPTRQQDFLFTRSARVNTH